MLNIVLYICHNVSLISSLINGRDGNNVSRLEEAVLSETRKGQSNLSSLPTYFMSPFPICQVALLEDSNRFSVGCYRGREENSFCKLGHGLSPY